MDIFLNIEMYNFFQTVRGVLIYNAALSVYNCSMSTSSISYFQKFDGVKKLLKLKGIAIGKMKMFILFALAYIIDKENNDMISTTNGKQNLTFLWQVDVHLYM